MKKTIFEKEVNQLTHISGKLKNEIKNIENSEIKKSAKEKYNDISNAIMNFLRKYGKFIKSDTNFYYFYNIENKLYFINNKSFSYLISLLSGINLQEKVFSYIKNDIELECFENGENVEIKKFSHYKRTSNTLYVFNNGNKIIKITEKSISEINNGEEGIIFLSNESFSEWDFIKDLKDYKKDLLLELLESLNLDEGYLKKEQISVLVWYIYSLFFPELLNNRGIITLVGEKGSGKTFFLEMLLLIFTGKSNSISNLPQKEDDLKSNFINEYLCYFDNVDDKVTNSRIDLLCSVSTGASIKVRKLYTNLEQINTKINCFIGITSRNPTFKRDDFVDRTLLFFFKRRNGFDSDNIIKEQYDSHRSEIMSKLCYHLQKKISQLKEIKKYKTNFRLSDFANFAMNINKGKEEYVENILKKLELNQQELTTQTDSLLELIKDILENRENSKYSDFEGFIEGKEYTSAELHRIFTSYVSSNRHLKYSFNSAMSLGKILNNNINAYKNIHNIFIEIKKIRGNVKVYSIKKRRID